MNIQEKLESVYLETKQIEWIKGNRFVFEQAKINGLALAGSIAIALAKKRSSKLPSDIDFVCASAAEAMAFIQALEFKLMGYKSHWRVYVNHNNEYCPPGCSTHFRFQSAMWLPICIMVIPHERFKFWFCEGGARVQIFELVKKAGEDIGVIDGKDRDLSELREKVVSIPIDFSLLINDDFDSGSSPEDPRGSMFIPFESIRGSEERKPYDKDLK